MNYKKITILVILAFVVVGIAYDVWVIASSGTQNSISWIVWTAAHHYPIIPLATGILMGHLFWTQQTGTPFTTMPHTVRRRLRV